MQRHRGILGDGALCLFFKTGNINTTFFFNADRNDPLERKLDTGPGGIIVAKFLKGDGIVVVG